MGRVALNRAYASYARTAIDPLSGDILVFTRDTLRAIDPTLLQLKWAARPIGNLGDGNAIVHVQRREIYLLVTGAIYVAKLDVSPQTITIRKIPGYPEIKSGSFGMAVHEPTGNIVMWDGKRTIYVYDPERQSLKILPPPNGSAPSQQNTGRVYSQWLYLPEKDLFLGISPFEGVWMWRPALDHSGSSLGSIASSAKLQNKLSERHDQKDGQARTAGVPPTASFRELCARPETLLCDPLDDTPISGPAITEATTLRAMSQAIGAGYGSWRRAFSAAGTQFNPTLDTAMGEGGSLKFTIRSQTGAGWEGQYTVDVSPDYSLGVVQGETLRIRFKVRWSCEVLYTDCDPQSPTYKQERRKYAVTDGFGGIKVFAVGEQDRQGQLINSGEGLKTPVWANRFQLGALTGYIASVNWHIEEDGPSGTNDEQPGGPNTCLRSGTNYVPGHTCHMMQADQWVTMQMDLFYGGCATHVPSGPNESHVKLWIADEGQPFELVVDKASL